MSVQTIHRTTHTANFTVLPNAIWQSGLSIAATSALTYLLSKPPYWKLRITDLRNKLGIGRDRVYRALNELVRAGYAKMTRLQRGVRWEFFDIPQTDSTPEPIEAKPESRLPEIQHTERREALERTERHLLEINKEQQHSVTIIEPNQPASAPSVVVSDGIGQSIPDPLISAEIEKLPIKQSQKRAATNVLSGLTSEQVMVILAVFASALNKGGVNNPIGYLTQLKKAALNDTLTASTAPQQLTLSERIAKEEASRKADQERHRISNDDWAESMIAKLGLKAFLKIAPWYTPKQATV